MLTALYIHIPFCKTICSYCDFHKEVATFAKKKRYINALKKEILMNKNLYKNLQTIFIGGGTPSSLEIELQEDLFQTLQSVIDLSSIKEFTIESNPNDFTKELVTLWKKYYINRVSIGVQTFNESHLTVLNRTHNSKDPFHAVSLCKEVGINNISIDLIFSLQNQTKLEVVNDINEFLKLDINHLSYYSLILEEKTVLMHWYNQNKYKLNSEDLESELYELIIDMLIENGFNQYEVSNFERFGHSSIHNKIYWQNKEYLGIGSGSHSLINNHRVENVRSVTKYCDMIEKSNSYQEEYPREEFTEECIMGLRLLQGIHVPSLNNKYNIQLLKDVKGLDKFLESGHLIYEDEYLHFSKKGLLLGNIIFELFLGGVPC